MVFVYIVVSIISVWLLIRAAVKLERTCEKLGHHYKLPPLIQGGVFEAVAGTMPELMAIIVTTLLHGSFSLGVSTVVGSTIFNTLVVPGLAVLVGSRRGHAFSRDVVFKEGQFLIVSVAVLFFVLVAATIYHPVAGQAHVGLVSRWSVLLPICLYALYLYFHHQDIEHDTDLQLRLLRTFPRREWFALVVSGLLLLFACEGLVLSVIYFGNLLHISTDLLGFTVLAAVACYPHTVLAVEAAREGHGDRSLSGSIGANIFEICICIPVGVLIAGSVSINLTQSFPMFALLLLAILVLLTMARSGLSLSPVEGFILLGLYGLFLVYVVGEIQGVTNLLNAH
jgi:cation:H+ antiporter